MQYSVLVVHPGTVTGVCVCAARGTHTLDTNGTTYVHTTGRSMYTSRSTVVLLHSSGTTMSIYESRARSRAENGTVVQYGTSTWVRTVLSDCTRRAWRWPSSRSLFASGCFCLPLPLLRSSCWTGGDVCGRERRLRLAGWLAGSGERCSRRLGSWTRRAV